MRRIAITVLLVVALSTGGVVAHSERGATASDAGHDDRLSVGGTVGDTVECGFPVTVTDATGETVTVEEEPERVVVLAPSAAQIMWKIDAQEKVVGMPVNEYTASLEGSDSRTNVVGADNKPIQSKVVDLEPDLVLAPNIVENDTVRSLRRAGQTVYRFRDAKSMADVTNKTELTGRLVGEVDSARQVAARTRGVVRVVQEAVADRERPDVYYALGGGWTAGTNTFINDLITAAGGRNIAAEAGITSYKQISPEVITRQDPDWIVLVEGRSLPKNPAINGTTAVEKDQILRVNPNYINQPGPRTTISLRRMAKAFHPDVTIDTGNVESTLPPQCGDTGPPTPTATPSDDDASATSTVTPTSGANDTPTPTSDGTTTTASTPTPGAGGPGFTAVLALLAVATIALMARRD